MKTANIERSNLPMIIKQMLKDRTLTDKERKNLGILEVIRKNGPISRTDISKLTELNIVTVSNYVSHYIKKGLVIEGELDRMRLMSGPFELWCSGSTVYSSSTSARV